MIKIKKNKIRILWLMLLLCNVFIGFAQTKIEVKSRPSNPIMAVNDFTATLSSTEYYFLESKLRKIYDSTTNELVIIIVDSLYGNKIEDVGLAYFNSWRIGNAKKNNGIIILLAIADRKIRITLGLGFDNTYLDRVLADIIKDKFVPNLKSGKYYLALDTGIDAITGAIDGKY